MKESEDQSLLSVLDIHGILNYLTKKETRRQILKTKKFHNEIQSLPQIQIKTLKHLRPNLIFFVFKFYNLLWVELKLIDCKYPSTLCFLRNGSEHLN